jgi:Protein of unknown function (DUF2911)
MKKLLLALSFFIFFAIFGNAQSKLPPVDKSPMDMSYYPNGYPVLKIQDKPTDPLVARVIYSRPQKNGRVVFGDLLEYGKVWRMGANEATEIEFYQNVKFNNTKIKKGRYTMYCIPYADKWTIIINKETDTWGSFKYDSKKDIAKMDIPVQKQTEITEAFAMAFEKSATGITLVIAWDDVKVSVPISL